MKNIPLQFPTGDFTHTELARFNGKSNQTVWNRYLEARKTGQIVSAGKRPAANGKGSPALLWRVNPHWTMAVMVINPPTPVAEEIVINPPTEVPQVNVEPASVEAELQAELAAALA